MAQGDCGYAEDTFCGIYLYAVVAESREDLVEVSAVRLIIRAGYQEVVYVGEAEVETSGDLVNETLEGLGSVPQSKGHPDLLKQAEWSYQGCFRDVRWID